MLQSYPRNVYCFIALFILSSLSLSAQLVNQWQSMSSMYSVNAITSAKEIDYEVHSKFIQRAVQAANPKGFDTLRSLIDITRDEVTRIGEFKFQHIEGDKNCLCSLCQGEEGKILLEMYHKQGIRIVLKEDEINIVIV